MLIFLLTSFHSPSQNCDSIVPTFTVYFIGSAGTTWWSPPVQRNGYCCTASGLERCIHFIVTTDSNTCGLSIDYYNQPSPGAQFNQLCCGTPVVLGDTFFVKPGTHHITFCRPGNTITNYNVSSYTNCSSPLFDTSCSLITATTGNFYFESKTTLFPNPFHSSATLTINAEQAVLKIFDLPGKLLREEIIQRKSVINRQSLPNGIYYYHVISNNELISRGKFIVE